MEGIVGSNPVPMVEELEITSIAIVGPRCVKPMASDASDRGDGSEASYPWSLTHDQQVHNLKENWARVFTSPLMWMEFGRKLEAISWFSEIVLKLQDDPCLDIFDKLEMYTSHGLVKILMKFRMTFFHLAILSGDLKMVQKVFERSSNQAQLLCECLFELDLRGLHFIQFILKRIENHIIYTPLHLAIAVGDSNIVDVLLEKGADVNIQNYILETPLDFACKMGSVAMLQQLLAKDTKKGKDPLHVAVRYGDINFIRELSLPDVNVVDRKKRTPLHYLARNRYDNSAIVTNIIQYLAQHKALDINALNSKGFSALYVAVLYCNTELVIALLDFFKDQIRLNEECDHNQGPPIQIAFEGGFKDIERALMECDPVKGYMERLYRDRQVYVDAANAILVGAALIASVTFASWLQPPLSYTSYSGEGYSSSLPTPSASNLNYVDVQHNSALRAFWIFNALSFYFAIGTVVFGARSVLPKSHLFIKKIVEKLRTNLLVTLIFLACSVLFVIIAFAIAGTIVLTPLLKYQWYMIVPTIVGGMVCICSLAFLVKSMAENYFWRNSNHRVTKGRKIRVERDVRFLKRTFLN